MSKFALSRDQGVRCQHSFGPYSKNALFHLLQSVIAIQHARNTRPSHLCRGKRNSPGNRSHHSRRRSTRSYGTSGKSTLSNVLVGNPKYEVTGGEITFNGKDLLELEPEDRSHEGIFMSFQAPIEIPGVSMTNFMRAAVNAKRKYFGQDPMPAADFLKLLREKRKLVGLDAHFMSRGVNEGFSGGERKRNEIFQMAVLEPTFSILDETDSGLDVDALRIVAEGFNRLRTPQTSALVITHYQRMLDYLKPDFVHVLVDGRIVKEGTAELGYEIEKRGFDWIKEELA